MWESNPPRTVLTPHTGFEVQERHQAAIRSHAIVLSIRIFSDKKRSQAFFYNSFVEKCTPTRIGGLVGLFEKDEKPEYQPVKA